MKLLTKSALLAALLLSLFGSAAVAGSASTSFAVTATVVKNCTIAAAPLAFGNYDPVVANAAVALDVNSTVTVACTKGVVATVGLDSGQNSAFAVGTTRAMSSGGGSPSYLSYEIYSNVALTKVWGNSGAGLVTYTSISKVPSTLTDFGQIPAGQDQPVASYSDTVIATITF